jgi:tetratricopeptide (TPR) repeat protein
MCQAPGAEKSSNHPKAEALIAEAWKSFLAEDFRRDVDLLKEAAAIDPTNKSVWYQLCQAYEHTREPELAQKACERDVALNQSASSYNSLGLILLEEKDYSHAAPAFEKAAALAGNKTPSAVGYLSNLGFAYDGMGDCARAASALEKATALVEHSEFETEVSMTHLQYVGELLKCKLYEKAIPAAQRFLEISKHQRPAIESDADSKHEAYRLLGCAYLGAGQADKAREAFHQLHLKCEIVRNEKGPDMLNCVGDK